jgi:hypothetical protein
MKKKRVVSIRELGPMVPGSGAHEITEENIKEMVMAIWLEFLGGDVGRSVFVSRYCMNEWRHCPEYSVWFFAVTGSPPREYGVIRSCLTQLGHGYVVHCVRYGKKFFVGANGHIVNWSRNL